MLTVHWLNNVLRSVKYALEADIATYRVVAFYGTFGWQEKGSIGRPEWLLVRCCHGCDTFGFLGGCSVYGMRYSSHGVDGMFSYYRTAIFA